MGGDSTQPAGDLAGIPVRALAVEVVEGPDRGLRAVVDSASVTVGTADGNDLVLGDATVSRYHVELSRAEHGALVVDHGSTNGTVFHGARVDRAIVPVGSQLRLGHTVIRVDDGGRVTLPLHDGEEFGGLLGRTPVMRSLMSRVSRAALADSSALLVGESGTGKELIARALHEQGRRAAGPFVTVDCGALAPTLVASELFGHERGAFTGADRQHTGAFERAHGGTLFLDEIGELSAALQPALLGALERGRFRRVGGRNEVEVDVRLVCATHRDLRAEVNAGSFRLDLYYRLAVVVLRVPPLRERVEDIPVLVEHFLREAGVAGPLERAIDEDTMRALSGYRFPGNVRELRNIVEATVAMGEPPEIGDASPAHAVAEEGWAAVSYRDARGRVLDDFERRYLAALIERAGGNVSAAARSARMDRTYLIKLLGKHGLK